MFGHIFQGLGGAVLIVGIVLTTAGGATALVAFQDEQANQGQERGCFGFCGGPDDGRSDMNFGAMEAAMLTAAIGVLAMVAGFVIHSLGVGVEQHDEHRRRMAEAKAGRR